MKQHKSVKNVTLNRPHKWRTFIVWELKQEVRAWPVQPHQKHAHHVTQIFHHSTGPWVTMKMPIHYGLTNKFLQTGKFSNTEFMNNMGWLYLYFVFFLLLSHRIIICIQHYWFVYLFTCRWNLGLFPIQG